MSDKEMIANALRSPEEEVRLQALRRIAEADSVAYLDLIFQGFADESWRVRKEAIDQFMALPIKQELIGDVLELLHAEENAGLRNAAVETLVRLGRDAVPLLLDQASCPDHDVRKFIVDILGDIADSRAIPTLIKALQDNDSNVRAAAAENLGKLKAPTSAPALLDAMEQPDLLLQFTILDALSRIGVPVDFARLKPFVGEKLLRKALLDCLGKVGDETAIEELVKNLDAPMRNVQEAALLALTNIAQRYPSQTQQGLRTSGTDSQVKAVLAVLAEEAPVELQRAAIRVLGWMGAGEAVSRLLDFMEDEQLQQDSLAALADIGQVQGAALVGAWDEVKPEKRAYLAYIFGEAGCAEGLSCLKTALAAEDLQLKRMAAYSLGKLGDTEVLPRLVDCLQIQDSDVRDAVTQALRSLGSRFEVETFTALQPLLASDDASLRKAGVAVVGQLSGENVLKALNMALKDPDPEVRREAVKALGRFDTSDDLSSLLLALTDEDSEVRRSAVEILGNSRDENAIDGLKLALQDEDIWVRAAAVRGLGRHGQEQVLPLVENSVEDPVGLVSIAALETLVDLLGDLACPKLVNALDHPDEEVVTAALNLLANCEPGEWLTSYMQTLVDHPFWAVRTHFSRYAVQALGVQAIPLLEERLKIETEDLVRQQLQDLLDELKEC